MTDRNSYENILKRKADIMRQSTGIDYSKYEKGLLSFDYEGFMKEYSMPLDLVSQIQAEHGVGQTPLKELPNITALVRKIAKPGFGARIFLKDEACNDSFL